MEYQIFSVIQIINWFLIIQHFWYLTMSQLVFQVFCLCLVLKPHLDISIYVHEGSFEKVDWTDGLQLFPS